MSLRLTVGTSASDSASGCRSALRYSTPWGRLPPPLTYAAVLSSVFAFGSPIAKNRRESRPPERNTSSLRLQVGILAAIFDRQVFVFRGFSCGKACLCAKIDRVKVRMVPSEGGSDDEHGERGQFYGSGRGTS